MNTAWECERNAEGCVKKRGFLLLSWHLADWEMALQLSKKKKKCNVKGRHLDTYGFTSVLIMVGNYFHLVS